MKKNHSIDFDILFVYIFLIVRLLINMEMKFLSVLFVLAYSLFLFMLKYHKPFFSTLLILFLGIDNMLAVYFAASSNSYTIVFYGTVIINILITLLVLRNSHRHFSL